KATADIERLNCLANKTAVMPFKAGDSANCSKSAERTKESITHVFQRGVPPRCFLKKAWLRL
ncbi:MAG TPA: hypothetical protein VGL72_07940, partial [Bryobacteraceae bacterium]